MKGQLNSGPSDDEVSGSESGAGSIAPTAHPLCSDCIIETLRRPDTRALRGGGRGLGALLSKLPVRPCWPPQPLPPVLASVDAIIGLTAVVTGLLIPSRVTTIVATVVVIATLLLSSSVAGIIVVIVAALCITIARCGAILAGGELGTVILSSTLSDGHQNGLVIARRGHGAATVIPRGKTFRDRGREDALAVCGGVETFEEVESSCIQRLFRGEAVTEVLTRDMAMAHHLAALQRLRSCIICIGWVGEGASVHTVHFDLDIEGLVRLDDLTRFRVDHDAGNDSILSKGGNIPHDDAIAGT